MWITTVSQARSQPESRERQLALKQLRQRLRRAGAGDGRIEDEALLGRLAGTEDGVLEPQLPGLRMAQLLAALARLRHLVAVPNLGEIRAGPVHGGGEPPRRPGPRGAGPCRAG